MKTLRGIAWDHPRGFDPMPATAAEFQKSHPDVRIEWHKRSLHDFGAAPVEKLAREYDMVVLDHPWAGFMAATRCYLPLDEWISADVLRDLAAHSAGPSHRSYEYDGHQWALAIDAATPAASYRPDLLAKLNRPVPATIDEVIDLGRAARSANMRIALPLGPVDAMTVFLSYADNLRAEPFASQSRVVDAEVGHRVMQMMKQFVEICDTEVFTFTPITMMDQMSRGGEIVYCPLAYQYSNYSRDGFRPNLCLYADMPALVGDEPRGSHIGGTGLAISAGCKYPREAADYAAFVASGPVQRTTYFTAGGQPGHAAAWDDDAVNAACHNFFRNTRRTIEAAFLRPRYNGYIPFQYKGGQLIHDCLKTGGDVGAMLHDLDALYHKSLQGAA